MTGLTARARSLLVAHEPADRIEAGHRAAMLQLLDTATEPFSRHHYRPGHFTASGFVLPPEADALLMVHHGKIGRWLQPGGHIEPGDASPLAAACREVEEEAGVAGLDQVGGGVFDLDVHTVGAHRDQPVHLHFDLRFLLRGAARALRPGAGVNGARWVPLPDVTTVAAEAGIARVLRKLSG